MRDLDLSACGGAKRWVGTMGIVLGACGPGSDMITVAAGDEWCNRARVSLWRGQ